MTRLRLYSILIIFTLAMQAYAVLPVTYNAQEGPLQASPEHLDAQDFSPELEPRGIQELMFSLSHIHADTLNIPLSLMPMMVRPYVKPQHISFKPAPIPLSPYVYAREQTPLFKPSRADAITAEMVEQYLIQHPDKAIYLSWTLPEPPKLMQTEDRTNDFLIADIPMEEPVAIQPEAIENVRRTNWLHKTDASLQFSQAYLSPNWYQGGNNNLSLLVNLLWDVRLNEVYHPSILFESTLSYKLGLNSTPQDSIHKYSVSEDLLQYNMKFGIRAKHKWFYSFTTQLKTQILNVYGENSYTRKAAFLSPGELNLGIGMTYSTTTMRKRLKLNVSIAPLSYNLKTCIDHAVDPTQFGITAGRLTNSQWGSNAEVTLNWDLLANVSWRSRLFLFTNYADFQGDWENTFNFTINRFLSTQIYVHLRYDTTSDAMSDRWRHWMLKEILSFGFRYAFSSK
ncbi:MAG: DUF3078 domain-containing protein [Muribaculaceae bacterium]|nr:DUF3078 domain-containing protein [Muribaculaceae bacterium]